MVRALLICSLYNIASFRRLCSAISETIVFRLGDTPQRLSPRPEGVFFKCSRTVSWGKDSTSPNSTALPANARSVR